MRQPLKEKLQNAINRALLPESDVGALIVGGRRRNRKKKNKNKNNAVKNKKNAKKTEGKSRKIGGIVYKDDSGHESDPLIEDEAEEWTDNQEVVLEEDDTENVDPNKMPFGFLKKSKKDKKEKKDKKKSKDENQTEMAATQDGDKQPIVPQTEQETQPQKFKPGTTLAAMAKTVQKKPEPVKEPSREEEAPDGGFVPPPTKTVVANDNQTSQPAVQEKSDPEKPVDNEETELKKLEVKDGVVKSENSPLINKDGEAKESKLQDQQPGMLCCTIL